MADQKPFTPGKGKNAKGKGKDAKGGQGATAKGTPPGKSTATGKSSAKASATKGKATAKKR